MASDGNAIIGLWIQDQKHFLGKISEPLIKNDELPLFIACKSWLDRYFTGDVASMVTLPLCPRGSDFQKKVWQSLLAIPYGKTVTYGDIAKAIGCKSAQAVGGAVGKNPIAILIPCHRVIGKNGSLTGYAGGIDKKETLLRMERSHPD